MPLPTAYLLSLTITNPAPRYWLSQWPCWLSAVAPRTERTKRLSAVAPRTNARRGRSASSLVSPLVSLATVSRILPPVSARHPRTRPHNPRTHNPSARIRVLLTPPPRIQLHLTPQPRIRFLLTRFLLTPPQPLFEPLPLPTFLLQLFAPQSSMTVTAPPLPASLMTVTVHPLPASSMTVTAPPPFNSLLRSLPTFYFVIVHLNI